MAQSWPASLPQHFEANAQFSYQKKSNLIVSQPEVGPSRSRRRATTEGLVADLRIVRVRRHAAHAPAMDAGVGELDLDRGVLELSRCASHRDAAGRADPGVQGLHGNTILRRRVCQGNDPPGGDRRWSRHSVATRAFEESIAKRRSRSGFTGAGFTGASSSEQHRA